MMPPKPDAVAIVLATFNGSAYISDQLNSYLRQTHRHWHLFVSDDGSTDDTLTQIRARIPADRLTILPPEDYRLGSSGNFARLLQNAQLNPFRYIALSDQDDIWDSDKLETLLAEMQRGDPSVPRLVHADLRLIDGANKPLAVSFMAAQRLKLGAHGPSLRQLLVQNRIPGCTMLLNSALLETLIPIPDLPRVHDWWIALIAASAGEIRYIDKSLGAYRQHGDNAIGVVGISNISRKRLSDIGKLLDRGFENLQTSFKLAAELEPNTISSKQAINDYLKILSAPWWRRSSMAWRQGFRGQSPLRNVLFLLRLPFV